MCRVSSVVMNVLFPRQVLPHVGAGGPGVPAGAVRAQRRVLADRVLARAPPRDRVASHIPTATQTPLIK